MKLNTDTVFKLYLIVLALLFLFVLLRNDVPPPCRFTLPYATCAGVTR